MATKKRTNTKQDYSDRYGHNWTRIRRAALKLTFGRCSVIPLLKAHEVHHVYYSLNGIIPIADRYEFPLWNVFPVNKYIHEILHDPWFWITTKNEGRRKWGNRQKYWVIWLLRIWTWAWVFPINILLGVFILFWRLIGGNKNKS